MNYSCRLDQLRSLFKCDIVFLINLKTYDFMFFKIIIYIAKTGLLFEMV
jgi:hypothetical protein